MKVFILDCVFYCLFVYIYSIAFICDIFYKLVRKDMDVNEQGKLSNIILKHKLKKMNSACIAVLHFPVTARLLSVILYIEVIELTMHVLIDTFAIIETLFI